MDEISKRLDKILGRRGLAPLGRKANMAGLLAFCEEHNLVPTGKSYDCLCPLLQPRPHFKRGGWLPECPNSPDWSIWDHVSFFRTPGEIQARCIVAHTYFYDLSDPDFMIKNKHWQAVRELVENLGLTMKIHPDPKDSWYYPGSAMMIEFWRR